MCSLHFLNILPACPRLTSSGAIFLPVDNMLLTFQLADSFINRVVISTTAGNADGGTSVGSSKEPAPTVDEVGKALGWWSKTVEETDLQLHSMQLEDRK